MASGTSKKTELKLVNVARARLEELLLDFQDFLRQRGLAAFARSTTAPVGTTISEGRPLHRKTLSDANPGEEESWIRLDWLGAWGAACAKIAQARLAKLRLRAHQNVFQHKKLDDSSVIRNFRRTARAAKPTIRSFVTRTEKYDACAGAAHGGK
jgi:hypothetical protein